MATGTVYSNESYINYITKKTDNVFQRQAIY